MDSYQMNPVSGVGMDAFLGSVERINNAISSLPASINALEAFHASSLREPEPNPQLRSQISSSEAAITATIRTITSDISSLAKDAGNTRDDYRAEKFNHVKNLKRKLGVQVEAFQQMKNRVEGMNRDALVRQYAIVRPEASREEVEAAVDQGLSGRDEIFSQAIMQSSRVSNGRSALTAVRDRQAEIQHLAQTMQQLNELFQQMARLVEEQDAVVQHIDSAAEEALENVEGGNKHLDGGIRHAKLRRRWKWYCLWIVVAIIAILALVLGIWGGVILPAQRRAAKAATGN